MEFSVCFFKALTFVNVLNAASNEQRKHAIVFILVKPGSDFEKQRNIAVSEIPADFLDNIELQ